MENKVSMWMHGPLQKAQDASLFFFFVTKEELY
jgi:hypothetical protein